MSNPHNIFQYFINNKQNHNLVSQYLDNQSPIICMSTSHFDTQEMIESRRFGAGYTDQFGVYKQYRPDEQYFFNDGTLANQLSQSYINIDTSDCPIFEEADVELMVFDSAGVLINAANMFWTVKKGALRLYVRDINILNSDIKLIFPESKLTVIILRKLRAANIKDGKGSFLNKVSYIQEVTTVGQVSFFIEDVSSLYPPFDRNLPIGPEYIRVLEKRADETHYSVVEQNRLNVVIDNSQKVQVTVSPKFYPKITVRTKANVQSNLLYTGIGSNILKNRSIGGNVFGTTFDNTFQNDQVLPDIKVMARVIDAPPSVTLTASVQKFKWYPCTINRSANNANTPASWYIRHPGGPAWISSGNMSDVTVEVKMQDLREISIPKDTVYQVQNGFEFHKLDCRYQYNPDRDAIFIPKAQIQSDQTFNMNFLQYDNTTGLYEVDRDVPGIPLMQIPDSNDKVFPIPVQSDEELMVFLAGYKLIPGQDYKIGWPSTGDNNVPYLFINIPKKFKSSAGTINDVFGAQIKVIYNGPMTNTLSNQMITQVNLTKGNFFQHKFIQSFDRVHKKGVVVFNTNDRVSNQEPEFIAPFIKASTFFSDRKLIHPSDIEVFQDNILVFKGAHTLSNLECINHYRIDTQSGMILAEYLNQFEETGMMKFIQMTGYLESELIKDIADYYLTDYRIPENARDNRSDRYFFEKIFNFDSSQIDFLKKRQKFDTEDSTFYKQYVIQSQIESNQDELIIDSNIDLNQQFDYDIDSQYVSHDVVFNGNSNSTLQSDKDNPSKEIVIVINSNPI